MDIYFVEGFVVFDEFFLFDWILYVEFVIFEGFYFWVDEYDYVIWLQDMMSSNMLIVVFFLFFFVIIGEFVLKDGKFFLYNWCNDLENDGFVDEFNYQYMDVFDINIGINEFFFCFDSFDFFGQVEEFNFWDLSGFVLEDLIVGNGWVWNRGFEFYDLQLKIFYSDIGDILIFRYDIYEVFKFFLDEVEMEVYFSNVFVILKDIMIFVFKFKFNVFFWDNWDCKLYIDGLIEGIVNDLDVEDMYLALENWWLVVQGDLRICDFIYLDFWIINFQLDELWINMIVFW